MTAQSLPLFPLSSVLLPGGRMALQVFEQRYLDLVKSSLREERGFGIVLLRSGGEVAAANVAPPELEAVGCEATIVDWNSQPNGLLGITVEGGRRFRILSQSRAEDGLNMAEVEWLPAVDDTPIANDFAELLALLLSLEDHPGVRRLGPWTPPEACAELGSRLAQLLPVAEAERYRFLLVDDALERLALLGELLAELQQ